MSPSSIPAVLKRLAELWHVYFAPRSSWWTRLQAKRRLFKILRVYGHTILEYIATLEATLAAQQEVATQQRRVAFQAGVVEQSIYQRKFDAWKKTKKGKMPKEPKPL